MTLPLARGARERSDGPRLLYHFSLLLLLDSIRLLAPIMDMFSLVQFRFDTFPPDVKQGKFCPRAFDKPCRDQHKRARTSSTDVVFLTTRTSGFFLLNYG